MAKALRSLFFLGIAVLITVFTGGLASASIGEQGASGTPSIREHLSLIVPLEEHDRGNVGYTSQRGSYMSAVFGKQNFIVLDMDSGKILYQASFGQPLYRAAEIFGNLVLLQPEQGETMTMIDLFSGEKKEMEGFLRQRLTDDVFILTRDGFVVDVAAWEPVFRKNLVPNKDVVSVGHIFIFPTIDSRGNFNGYDALSRTGEPLFRIDDDPSGSIFFPESDVWMRTFPLPIIRREKERHSLEMLQEDGEIAISYALDDMDVKIADVSSPSPLKILDHADGKYLISLMGMQKNSNGILEKTFTYCVSGRSGDLISLLENSPLCFGKFTPEGGTVLLKRGSESFLKAFDSDGNEIFSRDMEEWFSTNTDIRILGEDSILVHRGWNTFVKCSLENGETTGLYIFPQGFYLESDFHVFEEQAFIFSRSMPDIPSEIRGTNLFSFQVGRNSPGWFDIVMKPLNPNAGPPHETFDNSMVKVVFDHNYPGSINENLQVSFPEGEASPVGSSGLEFLWTTPSLGGEAERTVTLTASLGPASKEFPVKIIAPRDLLEFTLTTRFEPKDSKGNMEYIVSWELKNNSPYEVDDLRWTLDLENMKCSAPRLPARIKSNETKTGSFKVDLIFPSMKAEPLPGGYTVAGHGEITLDYSRGEPISREFDSILEIPPLYAFELSIHDPELDKNVKIDNYLEGLKFFDEDGNDITSSLSLKSSGTANLISGIAPGLPDIPVKVRISFAGSEQWVELAFRDNTSPRNIHPWFWSGPHVTLNLGANIAPVANFRILPKDPWYSPVTILDGSISRDPDGSIVLYTWSSVYLPETVESNSPEFECRLDRTGVLPVTLTVTDNKGATSSVTRKIAFSAPITVKGEETAVQSVFQGKETASYELTIRTGYRDKAGSDAGVYLALFGPADKDGNPTGSGEMFLYHGNSRTYTDPFEKGLTDRFIVVEDHGMTSLEEIEKMTLRHNNSGDSPGWFVEGVTVKNLKNGKVWKFSPNRWLATDEPPDQKTYAMFTPLERAYEQGILFGGDSRSSGLIEASDTIFILPDEVEDIYFTQLQGSWYLKVEKDGVLVGTHNQSGEGLRDPMTLEENDWGIFYSSSMITSPTRFRIQSGFSGQSKQDGFVWVFPPNWAGYEKEARMVMVAESLISDLRRDKPGQDPYDIFRCGKNAAEKLSALQPNLAVQGLMVLQYGISSLTIFGGVEDVPLEFAKDMASEDYFNETLTQVLPQVLGKTWLSVMREMGDIFTSMLDAAEWATEFFTSSIYQAPSESYKIDLLKHLASSDTNFTQSAELLLAAGNYLEQSLASMSNNDPASCRTALEAMSSLVIGDDPFSTTPSNHTVDYGPGITNRINNRQYQYPLAMLLSMEMQNIQGWKEDGHIFFNDYFGVTPGLDKKGATRAAMMIYEPIIKDMARMAGILAQIALLGH